MYSKSLQLNSRRFKVKRRNQIYITTFSNSNIYYLMFSSTELKSELCDWWNMRILSLTAAHLLNSSNCYKQKEQSQNLLRELLYYTLIIMLHKRIDFFFITFLTIKIIVVLIWYSKRTYIHIWALFWYLKEVSQTVNVAFVHGISQLYLNWKNTDKDWTYH